MIICMAWRTIRGMIGPVMAPNLDLEPILRVGICVNRGVGTSGGATGSLSVGAAGSWLEEVGLAGGGVLVILSGDDADSLSEGEAAVDVPTIAALVGASPASAPRAALKRVLVGE